MRKSALVLLVLSFAVCGGASAAASKKAKASAPAKAVKAANPLTTETDPAKLLPLVQSADYKAVTEEDYVAVMKNLVAAAKAVDIATSEGKKKGGLIYMETLIFQKKAMNPGSYMGGDGKSICDDNWFDAKASSVADDLKKSTQEQYAKKIDDKFTSDEAKMRAEFQAAKAPAKP